MTNLNLIIFFNILVDHFEVKTRNNDKTVMLVLKMNDN